ncbi:hypothetical protein [Streptodolium elevatio]|uniref:Uncharacterized protein n=1 Tax=Streptodolium elevatio TaxID=3157996 RepID=A0ABV3DG26_9ACTN
MTSENPSPASGTAAPVPEAVDKQRDALGFFARWVIMSAAFLIGSQALDWDMTDAWWALGSMAVTWHLLFALAPALRALWSYAVGLRPESVDLGAGPLVSAHERGQLLVLRRKLPVRIRIRHRMDLTTRARRVRLWAASWLALTTVAAGAWAAWAAGGPLGVGASFACALAVLTALGDLRTGGLGHLLLRVPFLPTSALPRIDPADEDVRLAHAVALGRWDEVRAAVAGEGGHTAATVNRAAAELAVAECRYAEAADLARQGMQAAEEPTARSLSAQQLVRAVYYAHEAASAGHGTGPMPDIDGLAVCLAEAVAAIRAVPSMAVVSDAAGLVAVVRRDSESALRMAAAVAAYANGPIAAAHHCCTIARAYAAQNRPKDAARALERAREHAPGLARIGVVGELILNS